MKMRKGMTNNEIAELLRAVAASYQLQDEEKNHFRIIAYQRAADAVEHASSELKDLWDEGKLDDVPGIGKSIAQHLDELFKKGKSMHFEEVMKDLPPQMFDLMQVPGIGAKTAFKLVDMFKSKISVRDPIGDLEKIAKKGEIAALEGFGEESERDILAAIVEVKGRTKRHLLPYAATIAQDVVAWLKRNKFVKRADPLGSLRRRASTVGDIDIAVATDNSNDVLEHFVNYPKKQRVLEKGGKTASIVVPGDVQVDLMVQAPAAYGSLLQHFTGSKHHNIALREYALKKGLSLSEYGIKVKSGVKIQNAKFKMQNYNSKLKMFQFPDEESFYRFLELEWIPPEIREDNGEIEASLNQKLPKLVEVSDIKTDLQIHSNFDIETSHDLGESSMEEVVKKADGLGYEYIAFTEHNPSHSKHSEGQIIDLLKRKEEKVEKLNYELRTKNYGVKKIFNSLEIDILPSGKLPVPEKGFDYLDFALVSVHSSFRLSKADMTKRVLSALSAPKVKIFAHPTARKLGFREGIELDWERLFDYCKNNDKWLEINADPMRLDLPDFLVKEAIKYGVKLTLGTDAHHIDGIDNMEYGVSVARRGWCTKNDIINARGLEEFEKMIE